MPTIKDVANLAHVSVATVSRVINNKGYVNEETRDMVLHAIDELHYIPNELARSLFKKQSRMIGVIMPHMTSYYFAELLEVIENFTIEHDYHIMVCNSKDDWMRESIFLKVFQQYNIDGIIIISNTSRITDYQNLNIPIITIDHKLSEMIPSVSSKNYEGGKLAANKLAATGCKKILHFRGPSVLPTVQARSRGFDTVLNQKNIIYQNHDLDFKSPDPDAIWKAIKENPDADGIFCDSDVMAIHAFQALESINRRIPDDVEIIGFDNIEMAHLFSPKLTTISQNKEFIGRYAVETLLDLINGTQPKKMHYQVDVDLIERETIKKS